MKSERPDEPGAARPAGPGKDLQHFPAPDRERETATIYPMPKRKPQGRPPLEPGRKAVRVLVTLDRETIERGKKLGGDNLSAGIRKALARR